MARPWAIASGFNSQLPLPTPATKSISVVNLRRTLSRPYGHGVLPLLRHRRRRHFPLFLSLNNNNNSSSNDGSLDASASVSSPPHPQDVEALRNNAISAADGYVGVFVRMLGIDHDPLDREQAVTVLWKYSQGGKQCIDLIMKFRGCVNLIVNLLKSDSNSACEAAAGLLRAISSVSVYRNLVAESGAIEEIICLLNRSSLTVEVKEQCLCALWNLSVDEKLRGKIASLDFLLLLKKFLDDEEEKVKEAAGGVLANLALSDYLHVILVEAGIIQKLAELLKSREGSKVTRKEAKNVLLELAKDEYYRILIIEEGLVMVPIVGAAAYKSFKPVSYSWPSLPDGTRIERSSTTPSRYGASELLLGLNIRDKNISLEEAKANAIVGRTQQHFLARIGAIEMEEHNKSQVESSSHPQYILLPWMDGVARLVLILGLEDATAIARAAQSIADASINEHMRISFKEAGAINYLVRLLNHDNDSARLAVAHAVERLSVSEKVCQMLEAEGVLYPLVDILKNKDTSHNLLEKTVGILAQIFEPGRELKTMFCYGRVNGSELAFNATKEHFEGTTGVAATPDEVPDETPMSTSIDRVKVLDSIVISRLVEMLRAPSPYLQKQVASILECIATTEPYVQMITAAGIESGLDAILHQSSLDGTEDDEDCKQEMTAIEAEEAGLAISAASRLLTKLLDFEHFRGIINSTHFINVLREVLKSDIPLHSKDWVAACLVKLESLSGSWLDQNSPINMDVTLYEKIPRLIEQMRTSFSPEVKEAAVVQLHDIISKGVVDYTRAIAAQGGIFPLVEILEGSGNMLEESLAILYNLSMDGENHSAIVSAGAVPILKRIALSEGPQWQRALRLLRTLPT